LSLSGLWHQDLLGLTLIEIDIDAGRVRTFMWRSPVIINDQ
tara:strand:- start:452 stop:574 length:123 start_codon:yes stop_codon:yes gene_type:complete